MPKRQHEILIALVREFISTAEPVASSSLMQKYDILASPATIRNEMVKLEDEGYLYQVHTSSGRIPTEKAYRYYVNFLLRMQVSVPDDVRKILEEYKLYEAHINNLLEYTGKLLADLTHYTSLILAPRLRRTMLKYLRLTPIDNNQVLIILLTNTGTIINRVIMLEKPLPEESFERMTNILNERLTGMFLGDIHFEFQEMIQEELQDDILQQISIMTRDALEQEEDQFIYDGAVNLLDTPEFHNLEKLRVIMELLDEEKMVADILKKTLYSEGLKIYIGLENQLIPMPECTFITASYEVGGVPLGAIGIMGPTRMPYQRIIPVVSSFAIAFGQKLTKIANL